MMTNILYCYCYIFHNIGALNSLLRSVASFMNYWLHVVVFFYNKGRMNSQKEYYIVHRHMQDLPGGEFGRVAYCYAARGRATRLLGGFGSMLSREKKIKLNIF